MANNPANSIIRRLQLSVAMDGVTVSVGPGVCYTPNTIRLISDGTASVVLTSSQRMTVILSATGLLGSILAVLSGSLTIYSLGYTFDR
ncbi:hypothetical protein [Agrobacterium pusense]|uniref:hypothetical protein n=1 Tax=Agrobacterium pusense TaxID=648995 RepID=UPI000D1B7B1C|nr:hypothetical protein [Agrobacterium pusense]